MCGRRRIEKQHPELALKYGDMDFELVKKIAQELPAGIVVQLHNNGESLLYPRFGEAVKLFNGQITNIVTNGKLLLEKQDEIIDHLDTLAISVFEKDSEADDQFNIIKEFIKRKGDKKPHTLIRLNGEVNDERYQKLNLLLARRVLHSPLGSFNYKKVDPTIPEIGICLDFLHHLAINKDGKVSICVRFDPKGLGVIGDIKTQSLKEIWNCDKRIKWLEYHKHGKRNLIPFCSYCHFWGVPTGNPSTKKIDESDENKIFHRPI